MTRARGRRGSEVVQTPTGPVRLCGTSRPLTDADRAAVVELAAAVARHVERQREAEAPYDRTCQRGGFSRTGCTVDLGSCWCPTEQGETDGPVVRARMAARRAGQAPPGVTTQYSRWRGP